MKPQELLFNCTKVCKDMIATERIKKQKGMQRHDCCRKNQERKKKKNRLNSISSAQKNFLPVHLWLVFHSHLFCSLLQGLSICRFAFMFYYLDLTILISLHKNMHQGASHNFLCITDLTCLSINSAFIWL